MTGTVICPVPNEKGGNRLSTSSFSCRRDTSSPSDLRQEPVGNGTTSEKSRSLRVTERQVTRRRKRTVETVEDGHWEEQKVGEGEVLLREDTVIQVDYSTGGPSL